MSRDELINEKVKHTVYGEGVIQALDNNSIEVVFGNGKSSKFLYPSCFDKFLKLANEEKSQEILQIVANWKVANGVLEKEMLNKKMADTQKGIKQREEAREIKRIEKVKETANRNRMYGRKG